MKKLFSVILGPRSRPFAETALGVPGREAGPHRRARIPAAGRRACDRLSRGARLP